MFDLYYMTFIFIYILINIIFLFYVIRLNDGNWKVKSLFSIAILLLSIFSWNTIDNILGWPIPNIEMPDKFRVYWAVVEEPNLDNDSYICMWVTTLIKPEPVVKFRDLLNPKKESREPRSFRIKYSKELHREVERALSLIREGRVVVGSKGKGKKIPGQGDRRVGNQKGNGEKTPESEYKLYLLPRSNSRLKGN